MYKRTFGRKFNKDMNQRKALFKGLMRSLALNESIKTTEARAKAIKGEFESHITKAKLGEEARYHLVKHLQEDAVERLIKEIAPRMKDRPGGYTRIVRMGARVKDNAEMVLLELVEKGEKIEEQKGKSKEKRVTKRTVSTSTKEAAVTKATTKEVPRPKLGAIKRLVSRQKKGSS